MNRQKERGRAEKANCTKCGAECYRLCYVNRPGIGDNLVCVDCFGELCRLADRQKESPGEGETHTGASGSA